MSDSKGSSTSPSSPFIPMFEAFRAQLDEGHDRRERVMKASKDVTAASKKIIFTLQRMRQHGQGLPEHIEKANKQYHDTIMTQLAMVSTDLQDLNAYRYARQVSGGIQEFIEAMAFQYYLEHGQIMSYNEAWQMLRAISTGTVPIDGECIGDDFGIKLSHEDYILGIYDMTGELMRFAITTMATNQALPAVTTKDGSQRNVLTDMRTLRSALESLERGIGPFAKEAEKKAEVMRQSVEKVEKALYGLTVRGAERPKGWMPDLNASSGSVEVEG